MTCGKKQAPADGTKTREIIAGIFAASNVKAAFRHRLNQCLHASECGRLCARLIKAPGVGQVQCWTNYPDVPADLAHLYEALENPEFQCPAGLF